MELNEKTLPLYLQKDIKEFVNYKNSDINPKLRLDIYWGELYGSINSAQHSYEITKEVADYLRDKYLGI